MSLLNQSTDWKNQKSNEYNIPTAETRGASWPLTDYLAGLTRV